MNHLGFWDSGIDSRDAKDIGQKYYQPIRLQHLHISGNSRAIGSIGVIFCILI